MTSPPSPASASELARVLDELVHLRRSVEAMDQRLLTLVNENTALRQQLEHSETSRNDLLVQSQRLIELLDNSQRELRKLKGQAG